MSNSQKSTSILAYLALAAGILSLSFSAMFVRWAEAPGPVTAFYRTLISSLILAPFFIKRNSKNSTLSKSTLIFPILGGIFTGFDFAVWSTSLSYTTAANATLLGNTAPLWVALVSWIFFKEKFKKLFWLGLSLAMGGALLVLGTDYIKDPHLGIGDLLAMCSGLLYAGYYISTQYGRKTIDALSHLWLVGVIATLTLFAVNIFLGNAFTGYSAQTYLVFLGSALVSQIIGYQSITYALGHLPASVVSPTMIGQPILTALFAIPLLGEIPAPLQVAGGVAALLGIFIVNQSHSRKAQSRPHLK